MRCECPLGEVADATRRMLVLRRYTGWEEHDTAWALSRDPRVAALVSTSDGCPAQTGHSALFVVPDEGGLLVILTDAPRIGMLGLRPLCDRAVLADVFGVRSALLLTRHPITTQTQNLLPVHVGVLPWTAVLTRPLDHEIVPGHRRATADDIRQAGVAARGARAQLPVLRTSDPIAQYLGLRAGEVVRVDRLDGSVYLRIVTAH